MLAPPAHGIAAGVLPTATIVVAHFELRQFRGFRRARPFFARRHEVVRYALDDTYAARVPVGELVGKHAPPVVRILAVVDRHVPGDLQRVAVDLDLALP